MNVRLTPETEADIAEVQRWYRQRSAQAAARFMSAVADALDQIERYPEGQPILYRTVRRVLVPRFPYALLYYVDESDAIVFYCTHTARDPKRWQERADTALD